MNSTVILGNKTRSLLLQQSRNYIYQHRRLSKHRRPGEQVNSYKKYSKFYKQYKGNVDIRLHEKISGIYGRAMYITQREEIQGYYVVVLSGAAARTGKREEKENKKYMKSIYKRSVYKKTQRKVRETKSKK